MGSDDYERMAFEQLRAAQRALSAAERQEHERQAYLFALKAHELESTEQALSGRSILHAASAA